MIDPNLTAANVEDVVGARPVMAAVHEKEPALETMWADSKYRGAFVGEARDKYGVAVEIASRPKGARGVVVISNRWRSERTFGWLNFCRRLSKDYERQERSSEALARTIMIAIMLDRLHPPTEERG